MSLLRAALRYAEKGWPVFPLMPRLKTPLTGHGFKDATTDEKQIREWWSKWPDANVGIPTGLQETFDVLDVDGLPGEGSLGLLVTRHGALPHTSEQRTGNGRQLFFRPGALTNTASRLGSGLDTRGLGGYIVAPGSVHPNGKPYAWTRDNGLAACPEWIVKALAVKAVPPSPIPRQAIGSGPYGEAALRTAVQRVRSAPEGTRNDTLNREGLGIGQLVAGGVLDLAEAEFDLISAAVAGGLSETEARRTIASAFSAGAREPRRVPQARSSQERSWDAKVEEEGRNEIRPSCLHPESLALILSRPEEDARWVVDGLLPMAGTSLLVAKPKVGKSTLSRQLALRVSRGEPFLGRETVKGTVLVLAFEEKRGEARRHLEEMGAEGSDEIHLHFGGAQGDIVGDLRKHVEKLRPILVVVDPLFRGARVKDANDYAAVLNALAPWTDLARETGVHVLAVHHAGKGDRQGGDVILGSTAILGSVDTAILLKRGEQYRTISSVQRYGEDLPETVLAFDKATRISSLAGTKAEADETRISAEMLAALAGKEEAIEEGPLLAEVEGRTGEKRHALRKLVSAGEVDRAGKGKRGDPYRYSRSLVPHRGWDEKNENRDSGENARQDESDSRSHDFAPLTRPCVSAICRTCAGTDFDPVPGGSPVCRRCHPRPFQPAFGDRVEPAR